jgi:hypothetical protein
MSVSIVGWMVILMLNRESRVEKVI